MPPAPYKGLRYYTEQDSAYFFGRTHERDVIIANLQARRLVILYGQSGVGKTSLLRAGVAARLREEAIADRATIGTPEFIPVVFSQWRETPTDDLRTTIQASVHDVTGVSLASEGSLSDVVHRVGVETGASLLIIFDQFEDYSFYHPENEARDVFGSQFSEAVTMPGLPVGFLISIREDALATLDRRFKRRIPDLFDYSLNVSPLDSAQGREAIERPLDQWNRAGRDAVKPGEGFVPVACESDLVTAVLQQVELGRVVLDQEGTGTLATPVPGHSAHRPIEAPYLQLVMARVWEAERDSGSHTLRLSTLTRLGNSETIVKTHLDTTLKRLAGAERDTAADVLRFLVTPSGTKIALEADALADFSGRPRQDVTDLLDTLSHGDSRILRQVGATATEEGPPRYEIFHDVLGAPILDWRTRHLQDRHVRRLRIAAGAGAVLAAAAIVVAVILLILPGKVEPAKPVKPPPPQAVVKSPVPARKYLQDSMVRAAYSCQAAPRIRVASCAGTVPSGHLIDTRTLGAHQFVVRIAARAVATGAAQSTSYTIPYTVAPVYRALTFTAIPPVDWRNVERAKQHGSGHGAYLSWQWNRPNDGSTFVAVDVSPRLREGPTAAARNVARQATGTQRVSFGPVNLGHGRTTQWIYTVSGREAVDDFFSECGHVFAVLGATTQGHFSQLLPTFTAFARSIEGTCDKTP